MSISAKQRKAVTVLLGGASNQEAAKAAGVRAETLCRWKHQPDFARELATGQAQLLDASRADIAELREKALGAIGDALDDEEVGVRLRAASLIVGRAGPAVAVNIDNGAPLADEMSIEEAMIHLLAAPRTVARGIACGVIADTAELREQLAATAAQFAALASGPSSNSAAAETAARAQLSLVGDMPEL